MLKLSTVPILGDNSYNSCICREKGTDDQWHKNWMNSTLSPELTIQLTKADQGTWQFASCNLKGFQSLLVYLL